MAYPAGFSSDEDDFGGFMSDGSDDIDHLVQPAQGLQEVNHVPQELTREQKLSNLFYAIMNGNIAEVASIFDQGIDINTEVRDGWTALLLAASVGYSDIVRELISRGADVNSSKDKYTVLMAACSCPEKTSPATTCLDIVIQLIARGAKLDAITRTRKTAFMFAASNGNVVIVKKLISCCDINAEDNQGWNALFWAVNDNKPEVVQVLLEAGLSLDKIDVRGNTPAFYAIQQEHEEVIKLLPLKIETTMNNVYESCYQIETIFKDQKVGQKPQFYRDICCMLYGMKCEHLMDRFCDTSLLDFLSLNDAKLLKLGISVPYQRNRILTGLYKFHRHIYKQKSIPVVPKDSIYSTIDVLTALISAIRQVISMEASIRYISYSNIDTEDNKNPYRVNAIRKKIHKLKKTASALNSLTQTWDSHIHPVDLITNHSKKPRWTKWFACLSIVSLTVVVWKL